MKAEKTELEAQIENMKVRAEEKELFQSEYKALVEKYGYELQPVITISAQGNNYGLNLIPIR